VFYITSIGLYELFIDDSIEVPAWLEIHTLDDLKVKLLGVVVTVLGVLFLGQIVTWDGQRELLGYGVSIAAVIGAITFYTRKK
ncbi:MAG TPA: YqhA family protein, partial [Abditibacterium sp.]